jgi:hypothetical protein
MSNQLGKCNVLLTLSASKCHLPSELVTGIASIHDVVNMYALLALEASVAYVERLPEHMLRGT